MSNIKLQLKKQKQKNRKKFTKYLVSARSGLLNRNLQKVLVGDKAWKCGEGACSFLRQLTLL